MCTCSNHRKSYGCTNSMWFVINEASSLWCGHLPTLVHFAKLMQLWQGSKIRDVWVQSRCTFLRFLYVHWTYSEITCSLHYCIFIGLLYGYIKVICTTTTLHWPESHDQPKITAIRILQVTRLTFAIWGYKAYANRHYICDTDVCSVLYSKKSWWRIKFGGLPVGVETAKLKSASILECQI